MPWLPLLVGAAAALWIALILQSPESRDAWQWTRNSPWIGWIVGIVVFGLFALSFIIAFFLWDVAWPLVDRFIELGGLSTTLEVVALLLWSVAFLLRIIGFASNFWRMFFSVTALALIYHGASSIGLLPGYSATRHIPLWVDLSVGLTGLTLLLFGEAFFVTLFSLRPDVSRWLRNLRFVQFLRPRWAEVSRQGSRLRGWAYRMGFVLAFAACPVFLVGVIWGLMQQPGIIGDEYDRYGLLSPGTPTTPPESMNDLTLALTFTPFLSTDAKENWPLTDAEAYVNDAKLLPLGGEQATVGASERFERWEPLTVNSLPKSCHNGEAPCYVLTCLGGGACSKPKPLEGPSLARGTEYARVLVKSRPRDGPLFGVETPFGADLTILVQYWLFYRYDEWEAPTVAGVLRQRHEGDWEAVTIGLGRMKPLFVAYSAHCGGKWYTWRSIDIVAHTHRSDGWYPRTSSAEPALHPVVAVARGSHANYIHASGGRAPDWGSCGAHVSEATTALLSYAWNVRDRTGEGWVVAPQEVRVVSEDTPPMSFPGYWGASDRITLENFRTPDRQLGRIGKGPRSPPLQPLWRNPLGTIFHGDHWREG